MAWETGSREVIVFMGDVQVGSAAIPIASKCVCAAQQRPLPKHPSVLPGLHYSSGTLG